MMKEILYYIARLIQRLKPKAIKSSKISRMAKVESGSRIINSTMGRYSYCGTDCLIINTDIGAFCSIASNVKVGLAKHPLEWVSTSPAFYFGRDSIKKNLAKLEYDRSSNRTIVENDVWIGENVLIKDGVTIATGAVIGMGSVVTHNIGPYEIWAGNPARLIRKRFDEKTIEKLLKSKWWNKSNEELKMYSFTMHDVESFLK